jgi:hypothetical protein
VDIPVFHIAAQEFVKEMAREGVLISTCKEVSEYLANHKMKVMSTVIVS